MERNCIRRPTLLASPTTKKSQPPLQKCVRGRLGERPPAQQPPLQKMCARYVYPTNFLKLGQPPLPLREKACTSAYIWLPLERISGSGRGALKRSSGSGRGALPLPLNFCLPYP